MVNIIIVNYNCWKDTIEAILSIYNSSTENFRIIIIDNHSLDDSFEKIKNWANNEFDFEIDNIFYDSKLTIKKNIYKSSTFIQKDKQLFCEDEINNVSNEQNLIIAKTEKNLGFAGGINYAINNFIDLNVNSNIFLLNPDIFIEKNAIKNAVKFSKNYKEFILGMKIFHYDDPEKIFSVGGSKICTDHRISSKIDDYKYKDELNFIYGGAMLTNTNTINKVGLISEKYFLYWEEADWCHNASKMGIPFLLSKQSFVFNKIGQSIGRGFNSEYFFTYNSFIFFDKYYSQNKKSLIIKHSFRIIVKIIKLRFNEARGIFLGIIDYTFKKKRKKIR